MKITGIKNKKHIFPKHIFWYYDTQGINLNKLSDRRWYLSKILSRGTIEDIKNLDYNEIKKELPFLSIPKIIKNLWEDFFDENIK